HWINWDPIHLVSGELTPIADILGNVVFFLPLGAIGYALWRGRRGAILGCTLCGMLLSLAAETLQYFTPSRNPATSDIISNTFGTLLGALLAVEVWNQMQGSVLWRVTRWARREPMTLTLVGLALLITLRALVPFDATLAINVLKRSLRSARFDPFDDPAPWTDELDVVFFYALLAGLVYRVASGLAARSWAVRFVLSTGSAALLGASLELVQILLKSRVTSTQDMLAALAGGILGSLAAVFFGNGARARHAWGIAATTYVACLVFRGLQPFEFQFDLEAIQSRLHGTALLPYYTHYFRATVVAVSEFLDGLLFHVPLGFLLARPLAARLSGGTLRLGAGVAMLCGALAFGIEVLQLGLPGRYADVSDVVTACLGGILGAFTWAWFEQLSNSDATPAPKPARGPASTLRTVVRSTAEASS
ncbi:MAG: VanZ family protein, partial [Candidatus Krumholzibacteriia bacterium]